MRSDLLACVRLVSEMDWPQGLEAGAALSYGDGCDEDDFNDSPFNRCGHFHISLYLSFLLNYQVRLAR